jgi:hypothetical protein
MTVGIVGSLRLTEFQSTAASEPNDQAMLASHRVVRRAAKFGGACKLPTTERTRNTDFLGLGVLIKARVSSKLAL